VANWAEFSLANPELAEHGRTLLYQFGLGLGYVATVAPDGFPRLHPFCPILSGDGLYGFILADSPKRRDLDRDGRCAIHAFSSPDVDDEFYVAASARRLEDPSDRERVNADYNATAGNRDDEILYEFDLVRAMGAKYGPRPSWPPRYTVWHDGDPETGS
jgi:hypothetical protein